MCAFALGVLEGGRACRLSPVTSVAGCSMDAGSCTCRFRGVSCCTSGERARGYQANPGEGLERVSRRGRRLAGLVAAAATATGAGGRARERPSHLLHVLASSLSLKHVRREKSTLSVYLVYLQECRDPRAPRHQHSSGSSSMDPMALAYATAMDEHIASQMPNAPRICDGNSLCRFWADEGPYAAENMPAVLIPGALEDDEVDLLLAIGVAAWDGQRASDIATLRSALDRTAHDIAFNDEHVALYLHRDSHLQHAQPELVRKILDIMRSQPGEWGVDLDQLNVRCIELHHYTVGGGLVTPGHRDNGSKLTMSVMLSHPHEFDGGEFVTYADGMPVHHELERGDALLFESERLHNVCPVTLGMRRSLVIELWARPENSSNRFR